jgi:1-acyl-sn-glycerol-3-phosphate acyltransferase
MRGAITAFLRFCVRIFFRRIELLGLERVPSDSAVIFAGNHPNGLVDPLFLLCFAPKAVSFLGKAPLFRYPVIGWFVRTLDSIPVYRKQDNTSGSNAETFARAREVLQRGGAIAIFPEGTTHDDPRLRELKTGAARIALGANVASLAVVPTGIYYTAKHRFRSSALVLFGDPIPVRPLIVGGEPPVDEVDRLTSEIDSGLDEVTLQAESHAALELIARAEDIFTADEDQPLAEEFDLRRRFIEGYHYLCKRDSARLERLRQSIAQFDAELRQANLDVHELRPRIDPTRLFRLLVLLPLAVVGAIAHFPAYQLIAILAKRYARSEASMLATIKLLGGLALYPLTYIAFAVVVGSFLGAIAALATALLLPILGWIALRAVEDVDGVIGDLRAVLHRVFRQYGHARLVAQREAIRDEMLNVAREMDG